MTPKSSVCAASMAITSVLAIAAAVTPTAAAAPWCAVSSLSLRTGPDASPGDFSQMHVAVTLTNVSSESCSLRGYPGVDLVGPNDPMFGPTYSLPRESGTPQPLILGPGASASSVLTVLPAASGWVPDAIVVTPPDATRQLRTPWIPGGVAVLRQDGATHPGTYVGPLQLADA